jgi:hypothetical protein
VKKEKQALSCRGRVFRYRIQGSAESEKRLQPPWQQTRIANQQKPSGLTGFLRNCHNRGLRRKRFANGFDNEAASKKKTAAVDETLKNLS